MTCEAVDLTGYFARIGYVGPHSPNLAVLRALTRLQPTHIAFENLDVLLKRPIWLDAATLWRKLVSGRRGGYCYEHNTLLLYVLNALGFQAAPLLARVLWQRDPARPIPRTHMLLRIDLPEGLYIADVGFGACTPTAPLALVADVEQQTPLEQFRLKPHGPEYDLQVQLSGEWIDVYRFRPDPVLLVDCEPPNWFHSTCPDSPFTQRLVAGRADSDRRHFLRDLDHTVHHRDGSRERQTITDGAALLRLLETTFMIGFHNDIDRNAARRRLHRLVVETRH
ncbi:MAG TPA: arylamine N-acetyltransferase [Acetobacteraceae bacterium]|nr:arylamine N-acetyltransferase [Acetobacteraceae bacterium]